MLLLPTSVTAREANDTRRLLIQALKSETDAAVVVDASNLQQFDSSVLAVLLECERAADAWGKPFSLRNPPPKLAALAQLYGVDVLLMRSQLASATPTAQA
jgi:phospholipid transport system transporter-binding protein